MQGNSSREVLQAHTVQDQGRQRDEKDMQEMLLQLQTRDQAGEADFVFTCGLTMEPFRDPVVTPDGNSYERAALMEHLHKVLFLLHAGSMHLVLSLSLLTVCC